ncbi:unnamed protein product [Amoebophrya sp. A120]|nr:unnamed protein product [Amoebophrya sp. A120]|eukprot:GSA120T00003735001.1
MAEQQPVQPQQQQQVQYEETQQMQGQYYGAFVTQDGYNVPAGVFHPPGTIQIPGQSFVGPPLGGDGYLQLGQAPGGFNTQPLQIGIPGGFHFAPEYSNYDAPAAQTPSGYPSAYPTPITRDAGFTKKKAKSAWCECFSKKFS